MRLFSRFAAASAALASLILLMGGSAVAQEAAGEATLADLKNLEARLKKLTARIVPATVSLRIGGAEGSGVIVTADGYVVTAAHVFDRPGQRVRITLHDGTRLRGKTLGRQERADYGLLKIDTDKKLPFVDMGHSSKLKRRQLVVATGHPGGLIEGRRPPLRFGHIVSTRDPFLRSDCVINEGDSGGPLFDIEGRVVGIHSRIRSRTSQNYHVPIDRVRSNWKRLVAANSWDDGEGEFPPGPIIGVKGDNARGAVVGCEIFQVYANLPAAKAGMKAGDIVTKIDDAEIKGVNDLVRNIGRRAPGDTIRIELKRGDKTIKIDVKLEESPSGSGRKSSKKETK